MSANNNFNRKIFSLMIVIGALFLCSCQTVKVENYNKSPLEYLSDDLSFYACIPTREFDQLTEFFIEQNFKDLNSKQVRYIQQHIDNVYVGMNIRNKQNIQVAFGSSFSQFVISKVFVGRNGFVKRNYAEFTYEEALEKGLPLRLDYYKNSKNALQIAFPFPNITLASNDMKTMYKNFLSSEPKNDYYSEYIEQDKDAITFCGKSSFDILKKYLNIQVNLPVDFFYGKIVDTYSADKTYMAEINIHLNEPIGKSVVKSILTIAFATKGGKVSYVDENTVRVTNIMIKHEEIEKLFN